MTYWDSSAIIPLLLQEPETARFIRLAREERITTWWATVIECVSGIARRQREGTPMEAAARAYRLLTELRGQWIEIHASEALREAAVRALKQHSLRAADALHLAAAMLASHFDPTAVRFLTGDSRLRNIARLEGFIVA